MKIQSLSVLVAAAALSLGAQPAAPVARPEFEVATLKPWTPPSGASISINLGTAQNGKVTLTNVTLADCIKFAYEIAADAQLSGPSWIHDGAVRFDVVGKAAPDTPREQLLRMLQTLLADRLKLVLHREPKELPYLALVQGKAGPKLQPATGDATGPVFAGRIISPKISMATLALLLSRFEQQTVLDQTGLPGYFTLRLEWDWARDTSRPRPPGGGPANEPDTPPGPTLFTAVQEQLGLRLESRKGPVEVLVVDSAEKVPAEN